MSVLQDLASRRIVPVVVLNDAADAAPLAAAMVAGGLPVAEITFRTAAAGAAIRIMAARGDMIVGAGTVLTPAQVDEAVDAGASFIVSPGFSSAVVKRAQERGIEVLPGVATPTEIQFALEAGLTTVKFFPAGTYGGAAAIKSLSAPYVGVKFVPTGGVSIDNLAEYLAIPSVLAVGGSWMVPSAAIRDGNFALIEELCAAAVAKATEVTK